MENKGMKILVHASTWFAPILVPIIVFFISGNNEVKKLSIQALIFHIVMSILISISFFFSFVIIGLPFLIGFSLIGLIVPILGIVNAVQDRNFDYPIIGSFIK